MRSKTLLKLFLLAISTLMSTEAFAKVAIWKNIPALVRDSSVIAKGSISIEDDGPVLSVQEIFKGKPYYNLTIQWREWLDIPIPKFHNGEAVLLFLEKPDEKGVACLVGYGTQAKWPKVYNDPNESSGYQKMLATAPLGDIENIVEKILQIESIVDPNEKIELCSQRMKSSNQLIQLTTMQYILDRHIWPTSPNKRISHAEAKRRFGIMRKLSSDSLQLANSDESAIQVESIRLLRYAHAADAIPILVSKITQSDKGVRTATQTVLTTFSIEHKIKDPSMKKYKASGSTEHLNSAKQKWNNWWHDNKEKLESLKQREEAKRLQEVR